MKPFLLEFAEKIYLRHKRDLENVTVVFPNRRAALYFRKYLSTLLDKPAFSPSLLTIEDFFSSLSPLRVGERLNLVNKLHHVYSRIVYGTGTPAGSLDEFFFWGEMLLRDFDEIDRYMISANHLFRDLSNQKELDAVFDYLTDEQREFLEAFWSTFDANASSNKEKFLQIWEKLGAVYSEFRHELLAENLAYEGMLHRDVAERMAKGEITFNKNSSGPLYFAGFNALTMAEERILSYQVLSHGAEMVWDIDEYYVNNQRQEAGRFFRDYKDHAVLGKTFDLQPPSNFIRSKKISLFGAAQPIGQAKLMAQLLKDDLASSTPEDTIIVLPDERLLMPVLHGISGYVDKLNVTMGFPLSSTPLFNMIELMVDLQLSYKKDHFNHRPVVALLGHPYLIAADAPSAHAKRKDILFKNWVHVPQGYLATTVELHRKVFSSPLHDAGVSTLDVMIDYLREIIQEIGQLNNISDLDREYCFHFIRLLNKMGEVFVSDLQDRERPTEEPRHRESLRSFLRLFRQVVKSEKIPFRGEPLKGLQVMGVLETRNLDFKNVYILSLNEGAFPSFGSTSSYIPYNIRKAYGLPTVEQQDSIYAYLFYRMIQRAENVFLFYNSETDDLGQGEMSRYLQQLLFESGLTIDKKTLFNELRPLQVQDLAVTKDESVFNELANYCLGSPAAKSLSPSALNDYLECRLKFYMKYVARIREPREVEEDLDARVLGNFVHQVMEAFYLEIIDQKGDATITADDFNGREIRIRRLIDKAFRKNYNLDETTEVVYEGQRLVVREIVKRFVDRIIEIDKDYAPFRMEALERRDLKYQVTVGNHGRPVVLLGGSIDRADRKEDTIRVIDYKTGKDQLSFTDVSSLFDREGKRNKAAFQTFLYTLIYKKNLSVSSQLKFVPGLMNRINLFNEDFVFSLKHGNRYLDDATPMLGDFEDRLAGLLDEMFDPAVPFDQTKNLETCQFCPYSQVCYR